MYDNTVVLHKAGDLPESQGHGKKQKGVVKQEPQGRKAAALHSATNPVFPLSIFTHFRNVSQSALTVGRRQLILYSAEKSSRTHAECPETGIASSGPYFGSPITHFKSNPPVTAGVSMNPHLFVNVSNLCVHVANFPGSHIYYSK
ncbi:hypothetical protein BDR07DRAFT_1461941 [Suillus spraguei]|nr:hypothetical protein BDR07DRAFT_1461941 [Suillus spraguei]